MPSADRSPDIVEHGEGVGGHMCQCAPATLKVRTARTAHLCWAGDASACWQQGLTRSQRVLAGQCRHVHVPSASRTGHMMHFIFPPIFHFFSHPLFFSQPWSHFSQTPSKP